MEREYTQAATLAKSVAHAEILQLETEIMERKSQLDTLTGAVQAMEKKVASLEQKEIKSTQLLENIANSKSV